MRVLGVDFGFARIGLAVGDDKLGVFSPRTVLKASGGLKRDADAIANKAKEEEAEAIVVGLPLDAEGGGRMARICDQLAGHLRDKGLIVHTVDESMTSVGVHAELREAGLKARQRRKIVDGEAAVKILERWANGQA